MIAPMSSPLTDPLPEGYAPAHINVAWLAALTEDTAWRAVSHAVPEQMPFPHLRTGTLADAGTAPLFDLEHEQTAWFYNVMQSVSDAHVNPAIMTREQFYGFGSDRAVLFTHEKRAVAHRGNFLRLWPQHSDVCGAFALVCAPTAMSTVHWRSPLDALIVPLSATRLQDAVRDTVVASARMNTTVLLARTIDRQDLY